jgi:hypothetical protein
MTDKSIKEEKEITRSEKDNNSNYKACEYCQKQHKKCKIIFLLILTQFFFTST